MSKSKGWKVRLELFVPADDKSPKSVGAAATMADSLQDLSLLRKLSGCDDLELVSSNTEFISRKPKKAAQATPSTT